MSWEAPSPCGRGSSQGKEQLGSVSLDTLQVLSAYWNLAAKELGRKQICLRLGFAENKRYWVKGVMASVPLHDYEYDVAAFPEASALEKYVIYGRRVHACSKPKYVENPNDPFGKAVPQFCVDTNCWEWPPEPSYEDAVEYLCPDDAF